MIYLCCDTNIWIGISNSEEPSKLLDVLEAEISGGTIKLILPEIIIKEWNRNKDSAILKRTEDNIKTQISGLSRLAHFVENDRWDIFDPEPVKEELVELTNKIKALEAELKKYRTKLLDTAKENIQLVENIFNNRNAIVLPADKESSLKVISLATEKEFPFGKKKNNFADCLIFFQFINYLKANGISNAHFVTSNKEDFFPQGTLHKTFNDEIKVVKGIFHKSLGEAMNSSLGKEIVTENEIKRIEEIAKRRERKLHESSCLVCYDNLDEEDIGRRFDAILQFEETIPVNDERIEFNNPNQLDMFESDFMAGDDVAAYGLEFLFTAQCNNCGSEHFLCPECKEVISLDKIKANEMQQCEHCEVFFTYQEERGKKGEVENIEFIVHREDLECAKCGDDFVSRGDNSNLCSKCEEFYGTEN